MQEGRFSRFFSRNEAAIHHHRIMRRIAEHLKEGDDQQDPAIVAAAGAFRRHDRGKSKPRGHHQRHQRHGKNNKKDNHLHDICPQRR